MIYIIKFFFFSFTFVYVCIIKLPSVFSRTSVVFKEHLIVFFSLTFFGYASKLNLQFNNKSFHNKSIKFYSPCEKKTTSAFKRRVKQIMKK